MIGSIISNARENGRIVLTEIESKEILKKLGINVIETRLASYQEEAVVLGRQIGFPLVLKIASADITHKSDAGGVRVGIKNGTELRRAYREIMASARQKYPAAKIDGVSVQGLARPGIEVIIGMFKDSQFGPVVMFGLGGILVEVLKDVSFRIVPLAPRDAREMIQAIKGYSLLQGCRGQEPADIPSLEDVLMKISALAERTPGITEIDLNPVFAYKDGIVVVDARIVIEGDEA